jgi:translocation and assembly module TamB
MTKPINTPPNPEPDQPKGLQRLLNQLKSSPKMIVGGVAAIAAVGSLGYWGIQVLAKKKLSPFLENQISKIIERPLDLGELKSFSLTGVEFGQTVISPTATDTDKVTVKEVKVGFNIIPILFRRTLPLEVALIQPDIYLEQAQDGEWVNLDFLKKDTEKKEPLVYFDVDLDVEQANITAVPYQQKPLQGKVDGNGRYNQKQAFAEYDLDATIQQAKATIKGETKLETGSTDTKLVVVNLVLADAARFLPIAVEINSGTLNADLDINIPSFDEITAANVKGKVNLQNLSGSATDLDAPISAESQLNFSGRNAEVNQTQATLGDITAQVEGQVNLDSGYNLDVDVLPFQLASLPNKLTQQLPVDMVGEIAAQVQLRGEIKDPKLTGKINNTQTVIINQTTLKKIDADFRGDLDRVVLDDVQIIPVAGGKVMAAGRIDTNLRQTLKSKQPIDSTKMPVALSFTADLPTQQLVNSYYQLPQQVAIGDLQAEGQIDGTLNNPQGLVKWNIADSSARNLEDVAGSGELVIANQNILLQDTEITYGQGKVDLTADANLSTKKWQASLDANSLNLRPFADQFSNPNLNLDQPLAVDTAQAKFNGSLDRLGLEQIAGTADLNLDVNGGDVVVNSQLNGGNIQAKATPSNIKLDSFIPSLPVTASLTGGTINTSGKVAQLLAFKQNPNLNSLQADADLDLLLDGKAVAVNSQLNSGKIQATANTSQINLNRFASNLPIPANIRSSQLTASGELRQLLTWADNPNLSTFAARVDADLGVAEGMVKAIANLKNNQWQANLDANDLSSQLLLDRLAPANLAALQVDNINAQGNLAGDIRPLINQDARIPVAVNQLAVDSGVQNLKAQGNLTLANITSNLDADSNLNVIANLDFDRLPIDQLVAQTSQNNELIKESVNFRGKAAFNGQFNGQQLLSAPTENISLTGDLNLQNFAFNDIVFDPIMTGKLNVQPQQEIALNLQGQQDIIAARAVPCNARRDCRLPYLPTNLEVRQGEDTEQPVIAVARRNGDRFALDIDNFPLALLNVAPGKGAGIEGPISGTTTGEIDLNLYTLATTGDIKVANPGLGYIQADQLNANFNYDPANSLAEVSSASLKLDRSQYDLNAALNLATGKIDGKLNIPQAYIQDALTTLNWFTVEDVISLLQTPDYADPSAIRPAPEKDTVDQSIARKLNQLRRVNRQIQANAAIRQAGSIPTKLDIKGKYAGEVILGGTIQVPEADFRVEGNDWQWQPRQAYPDIVSPLGLVIEESQYIALPKLLIDGELQGTTVDLAEARIEVQEAILSLKGKLSAQQTDAKFAVANLTVDDIDSFVEIPVDLAGEINSIGTIKGTLEQPQLEGKVAFSNGAFNGNLLPAKVAGNFNYDGSNLGFKTTAPDAIQVEANLPYPIIPGKSDRFTAKANLESEAFVFLDAFSQNYLNWAGGEGDAQLEASARLDLERAEKIYDLSAQGVINLDDAKVIVQTPFFTEPFQGTGKITINNQIVNVEAFDATFAHKDLSAAGKFPILTPVRGLQNPLTINLPAGDIEIEKLYQGGVEGRVTVTGASLKPVIGGEVTLAEGEVSIPQTKTPTAADAVQIGKSQAINAVSGVKSSNKASNQASRAARPQTAAQKSVITTLNNLKVNLQDFKLQQTPLYDFQLKGGLTLNGTVDEPNNIIPQGKLILTKADVDLFSNSFDLARNRDNTIIFNPKAGVFNPELDVILKTSVEDVQGGVSSLRLAESNANEIDDSLASSDNSQTVRISLVIDGEAQEILPTLGQTASFNCDIRPNNQPFVKNQASYNQAELNRFTQCFGDNFSLVTQDNPGEVASQRSLINSSAVALTSTPSLNQGEILNLLSNQFVGFASDVTSASQSELFDLGVQRFVVNPLLDSVLYRVEDATVGLGEKINLDYLTIYPNLEGTYQINQDSSVRFIYSHNLFTKLVETINSTGDEETSSSNEIKLEYQRRF